MRTLVFIVSFLLGLGQLPQAQNLVVNPSFEEFSSCPNDYGQINRCLGWESIGNTPDYFNLCGFYFGQQFSPPNMPFHENGIASPFLSSPFNLQNDTAFREFMQGTLTKQLEDELYFVSVHALALPENRTDRLDILFSSAPLNYLGSYPKGLVPQVSFQGDWIGDYGNWKQHCACFSGLEGANYLTIGNFGLPDRDSAELPQSGLSFSNQPMLDYIQVVKTQAIFTDTSIIKGQCIDFTTLADTNTYLFTYNGDTIQTFCPQEAGTYIIQQFPIHCTQSFDLTIKVEECLCNVYFPNVINPNSNDENSTFRPIAGLKSSVEINELQIWDRWGSLIFDKTKTNEQAWDGRFNGKPCQNGVYFYQTKYQCCMNGSPQVFEHTGTLSLVK